MSRFTPDGFSSRYSEAPLREPRQLGEVQFALCYQTATFSTHATEREAWIAHDTAVISGLNPDALAVVRRVR